MDTRVLLANTNKRFESIFQALGIIDTKVDSSAAMIDGIGEITFNKIVELENKLDAIMAHLGIELPVQPADEGITPETADAILEHAESVQS